MAVPLTLRVFKGDQLVTSKDYDRDIIKIGRLSSAHLCLEDEKVSRIHSVIEVSPDGALSIIDMGSVEGTFVNGKRVNKGTLVFGDEIKVGNTTIKVEHAGAAPSIAPVMQVIAPAVVAADAATVQVQVPAAVQPQFVAAQVQAQPVVEAPPPVQGPVHHQEPAAAAVQDEASGASVRGRPRRRKGTGPLGVELRFLWGDTMVGEYFLHPDKESSFKVGTGKGVQFEMGDSKFDGPVFEVARHGKAGTTVRFTGKMNGELNRNGDTMTLEQARKTGAAQSEGDAYAITMQSDDFVWVDLGSVVVEIFFQPQPKAVLVPFTETVDFTTLNIFLVTFFLGALFIISAAIRQAEGDEYSDELSDSQARIAKLLIKPPEKTNPILQKYEKKKDSGEIAAKHKGDEGQMGKKEAPKRSAHAAPKGDPNNKDQARMLVAKVFGGGPSSGISTIFGHQGLGGELKSAMGNMFGAAPGDAQGFGGLGLRGSGSGGGGVGDTIGIGGIGTKGRGGGTGGYGSGIGVLGGKKDVDIGITNSDPVVMGSLDKELIRKVIHANRAGIKYCYESQINRFPKLEGKVAVRFVISGQGTVADSKVVQSTMVPANAELEACVAGRVRTLVFPKPRGGGVVVVTYPFIFKQSGQ